MPTASNIPASLWRRLAAMFYDTFLVVALLFVTTTLMIAFLNDGMEIAGPSFQLFLYLQAGAFYAYFWHFKGQTLGMQVWKIRTINDTGQILTLGECAVRFFFATFSTMFLGLGFVWILFDREKLAWHDRASGTRVIFLGEDPYQKDASND
ncbi:MAG: RDD family protein [Candidatus Azotimanducaceae bacterium WSBS_2022_MAG_OTU7]